MQIDMSDKFGINMKRYCREHEARVKATPPSRKLLEEHLQMIQRLQHERLIHLIVLVMVVFVELFTVDLAVLHPETNPLAAVMMLVLAVLLLFYFFHYFFLENAVQRWYTIADDTRSAIEGSATIQALLCKMDLTTDDVADYHLYPIADNDSPRLSADRLEYTLGNLVNYGFITPGKARWMLDALDVLENEEGQEELGFTSQGAATAFANGALEMGRIYVSEPDRFSMQMLAELLNDAKRAGVIQMDDLWQDEPYLIAKLCRNDRYKAGWQRYRRYSQILLGDGGMVIHAKKRYIDPLVCGAGRVSAIDSEFRKRVEAFLQETQDEPLIGV